MEQTETMTKAKVFTLKPYQHIGSKFLAKRKCALIADEMGLGKTAQLIIAADLVGALKVLIVCPAAVRINWTREFDLWSNIKREFKVCFSFDDAPTDNCVISYDYLGENGDMLALYTYDLVIFDESHFIKEPKAKRTIGALGKDSVIRKAKNIWFSSGTPAPNNPQELWVMLFTFGRTRLSYDEFTRKFCNGYRTSYGFKVTGAKKKAIPELRELLRPVMIRRKKDQVMKELPPIKYESHVVQGGSVNLELASSFTKYVYPNDKTDEMAKEIDTGKYIIDTWYKRYYKGDTNLNELAALASSVSTYRRFIGLQKIEPLVELFYSELENNVYDKLVIFAVHRDVIFGFQQGLKKFNPRTLYGKTNPGKRQRNIDNFQNNPRIRVFIGNIVAAGTGITLTASNQVAFVEQDWVPGNNAQAAMRCHRLGQTKPVTVRTFGLADSLDERINSVLTRKSRDLTAILD